MFARGRFARCLTAAHSPFRECAAAVCTPSYRLLSLSSALPQRLDGGAGTANDWLRSSSPLRGFASQPVVPASAPPAPEPTDDEPDEEPAQPAEPSFVPYAAPLAVPVRRVKILSLVSLAAAVVGAPIVAGLAGGGLVPVVTAAWVLALSMSTTGLLTWTTAPYLLSLSCTREPGGGLMLRGETLTWLAATRVTEFRLEDVRLPASVHPLATFSARVQGRSRLFFVDADSFPDAALLERLRRAAEAQTFAELEAGATTEVGEGGGGGNGATDRAQAKVVGN